MLETFSWQTNDGIEIYGAHWPQPDARAVIGLVHGLGEHVQRYAHVADFFNQRQMAVVGYDRQGHGQSAGRRGHTTHGLNGLLDEIAHLLTEIEERYPDTPVFLYGHSMGGNLLLNYLLRRHPVIQGAIVTAPHITLSFQPSAVMVTMGKLMRNVYPTFTQANGLEQAAISRDERVVAAYAADPLVHDRLTAALGMTVLEAAAWLDNYKGKLAVPLLLMHGSADRITNPDGTQRFAKRVEGEVTVKIWEGLYHEIHNEPEQEQVLDFAAQWIMEHV